MKVSRICSLAALAALWSTLAFAANEEVVKPIRTTVQAVRYGKYNLALKQFATEEQGKYLLGEQWGKSSAAQKSEFTQLFQVLFAKIAFPKVQDNFKHLDSVTFEDAAIQGDKATVASTVVLLHPLKKQELKLKYTLFRDAGAWKVEDVAVLGDSMLQGIRDDQIKPILAEGGMDHLLKLMRDKAKELENIPMK